MTKTKALPLKVVKTDWKLIGVSLLVSLIHIICIVFLVISALTILSRYILIIFGNMPNDIQKIALDYSITIFIGSSLALLVYHNQTEDILKKIFRVKNVPPIKMNN
jgi:hypothetical protein